MELSSYNIFILRLEWVVDYDAPGPTSDNGTYVFYFATRHLQISNVSEYIYPYLDIRQINILEGLFDDNYYRKGQVSEVGLTDFSGEVKDILKTSGRI